MRREVVTSAHNPLMTHLKKLLSSRSYREKCGEFAADGTKLLEEAARWYPGLETVVAQQGVELCALPEHVRVYAFVDQPEVLAKANVFLTHCGMNSVSESLYMATPMVLYPQTNEQRAVARRVREIGAGLELQEDSAVGIRAAVMEILSAPAYAKPCSC